MSIKKYIVLSLFVWATVAIEYVFVTQYLKTQETQVEPVKAAEWCFSKLMPYGGQMQWGENQAGNYEYQLLAAKDGVEVWVPCE